MGQLSQLSLVDISAKFDSKTAHWLFMLSRGKDGEVVKERELPKSIGCGKNFRGKEKLDTRSRVEEKVSNLVEELIERLEEDKDDYSRVATGLTVSVVMENEGLTSRSGSVHVYSVSSVMNTVMSILQRLNTARDSVSWSPALMNVSLSASKFVSSGASSHQSITSFFSASSHHNHQETKLNIDQSPLENDKKVTVTKRKNFFDKFLQTDNSTSSTNSTNDDKQESKDELKNLSKDDESCDTGVNIEELIPSLSSFDPSILDLLPLNMKSKAEERVKQLKAEKSKESTKSVSNFFAVNSSEEENVSEDDLVECEECRRKVSAFTLPEHLDWHFAQKLAKQSANIPQKLQMSTGKRKRESSVENNCDRKINQNNISKYFKKS